MAAPAHILSCHRAVLATLLFVSLLLGGCNRAERAERAQAERAAVEETQRKLSEAEKALAAKGDALALATEARDAAKQSLEKVTAELAQRDAQLRDAKAEIDSLKKRDAFVFSEVRAQQQQGRNIIALAGYEKFLKDFPKSDLAPLATTAIAELHAQTQSDQQRWAAIADPKRKEREMLNLFRDGLLTPKELAPWIKKKTRAEVVTLLGKPSHLFPSGTEIGYNEKITNPTTGRRTMLVITFDADIVSALRADYAGQRLIP